MLRPLALAALALSPALARAEVAEHAFTPVHLQQLVGLEDFTYDTDWLPMNAPLQLRLVAHAGNSVGITMPGRAAYDWDAGTIQYLGDPAAGTFDVDVGLSLDAKIRFDVLGQQWESDILGPYDYAVITATTYTPYLLFENPDRPLEISDQTDPVTFVSVPVVPDILIASGNLDIDAYLIIDASLACVQIEASTPAPNEQLITTTIEHQIKPLIPTDADPFVALATLVCSLKTEPTIVLKPTLVMSIFNQEFEVANIELPIKVPAFDDTIRFDPIALSFPRPAPPPDSASDGDSNTGDLPTTDGDDGSSSDPGTTTSDPASSSSDPTDDPGADDDDGCSCTSATPPPLALLLLLALPRRRRHTLASCSAGSSSSRP